MEKKKGLEWKNEYSVGVKLIDDQHQYMFVVINKLIDSLAVIPTEEVINNIVKQLIQYKQFHFATEENYFKEFNYEKTEFHISKHREFNDKLNDMRERHRDDIMSLSFELVDFLEDWLISHLLTVDQEYKECFKSHGLK